MASAAIKLKSESSFKLRIESLLDSTAIRSNVIPMTEISEDGNGFFMRLIFIKQDLNWNSFLLTERPLIITADVFTG